MEREEEVSPDSPEGRSLARAIAEIEDIFGGCKCEDSIHTCSYGTSSGLITRADLAKAREVPVSFRTWQDVEAEARRDRVKLKRVQDLIRRKRQEKMEEDIWKDLNGLS